MDSFSLKFNVYVCYEGKSQLYMFCVYVSLFAVSVVVYINDVIGCSGFGSYHIFDWMHFGRRSGVLIVFYRGWEEGV